MAPHMDADEHTPDYPPKTPPPPKRPVQPPRPTTVDPGPAAGARRGPLAATARRGVVLRNRQAVNWPFEAQPWSAATARRRVLAQLGDWGYRPDLEAVGIVITLLVGMALEDASRRISVHLSDQDGQACVLVLSHQASLAQGQVPDGDDVLAQVAAQGVVSSCGTDVGEDGRRVWAIVAL